MSFKNFVFSCFKQRKNISKAIFSSRHCLPSLVASIDDDFSTQGNSSLLAELLPAVSKASSLEISANQELPDSPFLNIFPGEHYRLLAGLVSHIKPSKCVDIGTFTGMSAKTMVDFSPQNCKIHTFDILPWDSFRTHLSQEQFASGKIVQHLADLSQKSVFSQYSHLLDDADVIFCDAPKDDIFERKFLENLSQFEFKKKRRLLFLDDIKFINMFSVWRSIESPKLDMTSFGHWSGTGVVDVSEGLRFAD